MKEKTHKLSQTILLCMILLVVIAITVVAMVSGVYIRGSVVATAKDDLTRYGNELMPLAQAIVDDPYFLLPAWRIKQEEGVSGIVIINTENMIVYPTRINVNKNHLLYFISQDMINNVFEGMEVSNLAETDFPDTQLLLVGLPVIDENNEVIGAMVLSKKLTEVYHLSNLLTQMLILSSVLSIIAAIIIGIVLSKKITRPIIKLKDAAIRMANGELNVACEISNLDEIGLLANGFNYLSSELSRTVSKLTEEKNNLERLEEMRRSYIANISHEFRAPLTGIRGFVEPLMDGIIETPEDIFESYRIILGETLRLERLINDTLTLSALQNQEKVLQLEKMPVGGIIESAVLRFSDRAHAKGIELKTQIAKNLPCVLTNEDKLIQLLIILLDNAIKYSDGGVVCVSAEQLDDENIKISVADNGIGIDSEDLKYVFERFYKADKSRSGEGTGLGLSIAAEIARLQGGELSVMSEKGKNSTFAFTLKTK